MSNIPDAKWYLSEDIRLLHSIFDQMEKSTSMISMVLPEIFSSPI